MFIEYVVVKYGLFDVFVNNGGIVLIVNIEEMMMEVWY